MIENGNALGVSFFRHRVRLRSRAYDFRCIIEKRCGKLGRYVSFNDILLVAIVWLILFTLPVLSEMFKPKVKKVFNKAHKSSFNSLAMMMQI